MPKIWIVESLEVCAEYLLDELIKLFHFLGKHAPNAQSVSLPPARGVSTSTSDLHQ